MGAVRRCRGPGAGSPGGGRGRERRRGACCVLCAPEGEMGIGPLLCRGAAGACGGTVWWVLPRLLSRAAGAFGGARLAGPARAGSGPFAFRTGCGRPLRPGRPVRGSGCCRPPSSANPRSARLVTAGVETVCEHGLRAPSSCRVRRGTGTRSPCPHRSCPGFRRTGPFPPPGVSPASRARFSGVVHVRRHVCRRVSVPSTASEDTGTGQRPTPSPAVMPGSPAGALKSAGPAAPSPRHSEPARTSRRRGRKGRRAGVQRSTSMYSTSVRRTSRPWARRPESRK